MAFPADEVSVADERCDEPPVLVDPVPTPASLDPGDTWIYACDRATEPLEDPDDCEPATLTNTARVTAPGASDSDTEETQLICPPPRRPGVAIQKLGPETAVAGTALTYALYVTNIGEVPFAEAEVDVTDPPCDAPSSEPAAGVAGRASLRPLRGCLQRGSRVIVRGRRIASISVRVRGRRVGGLRVRALQRRAIIRVVRNLPPGRHRATAVIRFQRGSATPTVRLTRAIRVCAPAAPAL